LLLNLADELVKALALPVERDSPLTGLGPIIPVGCASPAAPTDLAR
jgi:hypothetical protein